MFEETVQILGPDGPIPTFLAGPDAIAPAVVVYMDAPGIREELRDFARRIARAGYVAVLPDMFYRLGSLRFELSRRDERMTAVIKAAMASLDHERVTRDGQAIFSFLGTDARVVDGPKGLIGYCMSGQYVVAAAGQLPHEVAAAAALHGVGIVTDAPDSPHLLAERISAELYFGFASDDPLVPDDVIPTLRDSLEANAIDHQIEVFPDTRHGFCFPAREVYAEEAAEASWARAFAMFERRLSSG